MMSADVPWIGALTAVLSASDLTVPFFEFISGRYLRLPKMVSTYPVSRADVRVSSMKDDIAGKFAK